MKKRNKWKREEEEKKRHEKSPPKFRIWPGLKNEGCGEETASFVESAGCLVLSGYFAKRVKNGLYRWCGKVPHA